jgi:ABC-type branched-subunit amino acid transport system permease subunit
MIRQVREKLGRYPRQLASVPVVASSLRRLKSAGRKYLWAAVLFWAVIGIPGLYLLEMISIETVNMFGRYLALAMVALSLDLIWGYTGMLCLCQSLFFALGGHLLVMAALVDSFTLWPVGSGLYQLNITVLLQMFGWMFGAALLVALPGIISMLLVNLTFGIATRSAPSLNIFVLGFPMNMVLGFVCVYLTVVQTGQRFSGMINDMLNNLYLLMR